MQKVMWIFFFALTFSLVVPQTASAAAKGGVTQKKLAEEWPNEVKENPNPEIAFAEAGMPYGLPYGSGYLDMDRSFLEETEKSYATAITFTSEAENILALTEEGYYETKASGWINVSVDVELYNAIKGKNKQKTYVYQVYVYPDMENATLSDRKVVRYSTKFSSEPVSAKVELEGVGAVLSDYDEMVEFSCVSSNSDMEASAGLDENKITVSVTGIGKTKLFFYINGKKIKLVFYVKEITLDQTTALLAEEDTVSLKVSGGKGSVSDIKWKSEDTDIATVNDSGVVTAKKAGTAMITANWSGGNVLYCAVNVTTSEKMEAIDAGKSIAKGTYSQARRMQSGYYDCSSLVWRAYRYHGCNFGYTSYAPTAAVEGQYMMNKGKLVGYYTDENIQSAKFCAGDLLFKTGAKNGRYKGI